MIQQKNPRQFSAISRNAGTILVPVVGASLLTGHLFVLPDLNRFAQEIVATNRQNLDVELARFYEINEKRHAAIGRILEQEEAPRYLVEDFDVVRP